MKKLVKYANYFIHNEKTCKATIFLVTYIYEVNHMINRPKYMDLLINSKDRDYVKLLIGVRRCGKSTLLRLMNKHLLDNGVSADRILNINFELIENDRLKDGIVLHEFVRKNMPTNGKVYLLLDEVQEIIEWARVVNSLRATFDCDIYATGSNARMFIGEHLTYLAGRYISISVFPLTFAEFIDFSNVSTTPNEHYRSFLCSSFPAVVLESNLNNKKMLTEDLFRTIFERDIIMKGNIGNVSVFYQVASYVLENIGNQMSIKKISDTLVSNGIKTQFNTVESYISLMTKSYFLYHCKRYDIKGKEVLKTNGKYYVVDFGIRSKLVPNDGNRGKILENFVFLELLKYGYEVYSGKVGRNYELDFVAKKDGKTIYVQVSESIIDPTTREREERPFSFLTDNHARYLVTLDVPMFSSDKEYTHLHLFDFLKVIQK